MIVRDDKYGVYSLSLRELHQIVFTVAGAACGAIMEDHPDYEFPSDRIIRNVNSVLGIFGIPETED